MENGNDLAASMDTLRRCDGSETLRRGDARRERPAGRLPERFIGAGGSRLEVVRPMDPGGEGELYLCRDAERKVVVKILNYDSDLEILGGLVGLDLAPSHLAPVLYLGAVSDAPGREYDRRSYIVSPYCADGDLARLENARAINPSIAYDGGVFSASNEDYAKVRCDYGAVDEAAFAKLLRQMHTALRTLHAPDLLPGTGGVVHRDVRPQNILRGEDGEYYLGDFGLVSALASGAQVKFTERFGVSHGYSPPEAYTDRIFKQSVTRKYDYFSLGMTLLHIAGGRPRYLIGRDADHLAPYETSLADFFEIISLGNVALPPELPARIASLLRGLLAVSVEDRFGDAEIEEWLAGGNPVPHELAEELQGGIEIKVNRRTYRGEREVALAIVENWELFLKLVASGQLAFEWRSPDVAYRQRVLEAIEIGRGLPPETGLIGIVRAVWPQVGHVFAGRRYSSDRELGRAMARSSGPETDAFAAYLRSGTLSSLKKSAGDSEGLDIVCEIEAMAASRPAAAVRVAGAYLSGEKLPALQTPVGEFAGAAGLAKYIENELGNVIVSYLERASYKLPDIGPVPGIYASDDRSQLAVVQVDGSVIGDANSFQEEPVLSCKLEKLLDWAVPGGSLRSTGDVNEELYARLVLEGAVRFQEKSGVSGSEEEERWGVFLRFLSLFPEFRIRHGTDETFERYFSMVRRLLGRVAAVRLPRTGRNAAAGLPAIDAAKNRMLTAMRAFDDSRSFEDLYLAFLATLDGLRQIRQVSYANKAAAFHVVSVFRSVFSLRNSRLQQSFDALMAEYNGALSTPSRLMEFMERLQELDGRAAAARKEDFGPYLLSQEAETLRRMMRESGGSLDYALPDTTDAQESFIHLQNWLRSHGR